MKTPIKPILTIILTLRGGHRSYTDQNGNFVENYSDSEWINLMKDELNNSRPIQYAGFEEEEDTHGSVMDMIVMTFFI